MRDLEEMQIEVKLKDSTNLMSRLNQVSIKLTCIVESKRHNRKMKMRMIKEKVQKGEIKGFIIDGDVLKLGQRLCVPQIIELKEKT